MCSSIDHSILKCVRCHQLSASPIFACVQMGHLLCGLCHEELRNFEGEIDIVTKTVKVKCVTCRSTPVAECPFAENISRQWGVEQPCPYKDSGCNSLIKLVNLKQHFFSCEFRDATCCYSDAPYNVDGIKCQKQLSMKNISEHWKTDHGLVPHNADGRNVTLEFKVRKLLKEEDLESEDYWNGKFNYSPSLLEFDGKILLLSVKVRKGIVYWWIVILGSIEDAKLYKCFTEIPIAEDQGPSLIPMRRGGVQSIPVLPYHDYFKFNRFENHYATATAAQISASSVKINEKNTDDKYMFKITVKLCKSAVYATSPGNLQPS